MADVDAMRPVEMTASSVVSTPQINEVVVSSIASELYEKGVSPHFLEFHGCMITRVSSKTAFYGRSAHNAADISSAIDELVMDLLQKGSGPGLGITLTNIVSTMSTVLVEWIIGSQVARVFTNFGDIVSFIQDVLSILQRSADDIGSVVVGGTLAGDLASNVRSVLARASGLITKIGTTKEDRGASDTLHDDDHMEGEGMPEETASNGHDEGKLGDPLSAMRVLGLHSIMRWIGDFNPILVFTLLDSVRRVFQLGVDAIGDASRRGGPAGEGSAHIHDDAGEILRTFAAYKARGVDALPASIRMEVTAWQERLRLARSKLGIGETEGGDEGAPALAPMYQMVSATFTALTSSSRASRPRSLRRTRRCAATGTATFQRSTSTWTMPLPR